MVAQVALVIAMVGCGWLAIREARLVYAALWLAAASALLAAQLYWLGAVQVAVVELSVGAGLVTVLLVLAIGSTERGSGHLPLAIPRIPALALIAGVVVLLLSVVSAPPLATVTPPESSLATTLWVNRSADMLLQVTLIFVGLLTVLGLLSETVKVSTQLERRAAEPPELELMDDTPPAEPVLEQDWRP